LSDNICKVRFTNWFNL